MKPLVVFGTGNIADIIVHYFLSVREVVAITVETIRGSLPNDTYKGLPLVPFEIVEKLYPPDEYDMFIAVGYRHLNHLRAMIYEKAKAKGYSFATYIDDRAKVHDTATVGENVFIFEFNNIQYNAKIGNDVILWSANHIGHETIIRDHVYIASHVVISGFCDIGEYSFVGVNAAFSDEVKLGKNCLVGMGANIVKSTEDRKVFVPQKTNILEFEKLSESMRYMYEPAELD
jgi:sugar O-acyltransferase (sialic acid O-acetyltransferase NeuD family)